MVALPVLRPKGRSPREFLLPLRRFAIGGATWYGDSNHKFPRDYLSTCLLVASRAESCTRRFAVGVAWLSEIRDILSLDYLAVKGMVYILLVSGSTDLSRLK